MAWGLKPKEDGFFLLLEESAKVAQSGAKKLYQSLSDNNKNIEKALKDVTDLEHKGDDVLQSIMDRLNQTFITPLDREDIYDLAQEMDDIVDYIHGAIEKMMLYKTGEVTPNILELSKLLVKATEEILKIMQMLKSMKTNVNDLLQICQYVKELESEGDFVYRTAVAGLFSGGCDSLYVIKWKEIYKQLEDALDHCENVAKTVRGVVLKYT